MDERTLREELAGVSGGAGGMSFAAVADDFVRLNRCDACSNRSLRRPYRMYTEEYNCLLMEWSGGGPVEPRCKRR